MKHEHTIDAAMRLLDDQASEWGIGLGPEQLGLLRQYADSLANYTAANVIGTREPQRIVLDHILDSLSCLTLGGEQWQGNLLDVGSGGGLPGIPLAVAQAELSVTLLESIEKKVVFLQKVRDDLSLTNLTIHSGRAEEAGRKRTFRDAYDVAVSRALAALPVVVEYCAPFVQEGGWVLAMKGRLEQDELIAGEKAARKLQAELHEVTQVRLMPELEQKHRQIVVFRKTGPTPTGYPRRIGLAKKRPLGTQTRGEP
ncbi:16S rRNA (guanine(527)-N(7))-methyltransferase RsmG [Rubrobacter marinus]|uniref:Ribosomal RNA small subunit methyltransferase G n=1 Tax=Rubrobacter marinus TaxID=2653852 RepID=A0A6G8Q285_9ACTN|nr:16S rRNA (guanine(527)-N(7))-methyltransferase RsmG [Rubrobacter marinus]QIN80568.1 16S rRNA (guanine(527)-N(7))-methyltransferase RsmG [Rubrobacter marinus]